MPTKETNEESALKLRSAILCFQSAKGHLEQGLHNVQDQTRLPFSAENLLGELHQMDEHLASSIEWVEGLCREEG